MNEQNAKSLKGLPGLKGHGGTADIAGLSPPYEKLFQGSKSEWVIAFGNEKPPKTEPATDQNVCATRKITMADIRQYRGFKIYLESLDFKSIHKHNAMDNYGFTVYMKEINAPPDGHLHTLTVKVLNSTLMKENAYNEFIKTSPERRGYFSISHAHHGEGLWIGEKLVHPEKLLESPAHRLIVVPISCLSYKHFLGDMKLYLRKLKMPEEKLTFFGISQEIEVSQSNGAFAVLKQIFTSILACKSGLAILRDCDEVYNPIMPSYNPESYKRDPDYFMVIDSEVQATPLIKGWIGGQTIELPKNCEGRNSTSDKQID